MLRNCSVSLQPLVCPAPARRPVTCHQQQASLRYRQSLPCGTSDASKLLHGCLSCRRFSIIHSRCDRRYKYFSRTYAQHGQEQSTRFTEDVTVAKAREELARLEQERDGAMAKASASSRKSKRLTEAVESLQYAAIRAIKEGNEATARSTLEEKAKVTEALQKSRNRAEANQALAARLERLIGLKQTELIALLSASGKLQPVDSRTRIIVPDGHPDASIDMGDDGNSDIREPGQRQLEAGRSNPVHEVSDGTSSGGSRSTHLHDAASSGQWGSSDDASASQSRRGWSGNESAPDAGGGRDSQTSSRSADLERRERWRSERDIDAAFLEMERQSLEALLSATPSARGPEPSTAAPSAGDAATSSPASSAGPQQQLLPQWWLSGEQLLDKRAEQTDSESGYKAGVRASALLARIVNGRVRGRDPKAADLSMLAVLSMRAHAAGVRVKAPSDLTSNVKQSIFRNALSCANAALQRGETLLQVDDWEEVPEAARENEARAQALANQHAAVYLVALATVLHLDSQQAAVMASAAVAATTRQVLLEAVVGVRQAGEERVAEGQRSMARLRTVLDRVAPPAGSPEMAMVHGGLRDFLSLDERQLLLDCYVALGDAGADSLQACADALGLPAPKGP